MSEFVPETTRVFAKIMADTFPADLVSVFDGEVEVAQHFSSLPFDHLLFTGSTSVGKQVMKAAAANLTPVTLELGGKSPAVISRGGNLKTAASNITHGKIFNSGQICVSPDYIFVPKELSAQYIELVKAKFSSMYPEVEGNPGYTSIVNDLQFKRLMAVLEDAKAKGATVHSCAPVVEGSRQLPLQIITGVTSEMRIMQEELFGPLMPIIEYDKLDEVIKHINAHDRPLALYYFGNDAAEKERVISQTISGGVTVNDWGWHVMNHDMPFGGIGPSGMGHYHGREGFLEFSHARGIFEEKPWYPISLFHPPYGTKIQQLTMKLFLR